MDKEFPNQTDWSETWLEIQKAHDLVFQTLTEKNYQSALNHINFIRSELADLAYKIRHEMMNQGESK